MIILTCNVAANEITHDANPDERWRAIEQRLLGSFRREFLNRLDDIIPFEPLQMCAVKELCNMLLSDLKQICMSEHQINLTWTNAVVDMLCARGYSAEYGARPLRRALSRICTDAITDAILDTFVVSGHTLQMHYQDEKLMLQTIPDDDSHGARVQRLRWCVVPPPCGCH